MRSVDVSFAGVSHAQIIQRSAAAAVSLVAAASVVADPVATVGAAIPLLPPRGAMQNATASQGYSQTAARTNYAVGTNYGARKNDAARTNYGARTRYSDGTNYGAAATGVGPGPTARPGAHNRNGCVFHGKSIATLVFLPCVIFLTVAMTWMLCWARYTWVVYILVTGCFLFSGVLLAVSRRNPRGPIYLYLGILCIVATAVGAVTGNIISDRHMRQFWAPLVRPSYENVSPSTPAAAVGDGGRLGFAGGARVDVQRSAGLRNLEDGQTYCVAPVVDVSQDSHVSIWAAGVNCCGHRGAFRCDDAGQPSSTNSSTGLVLIGGSSFASDRLANLGRAARQAAAAYGLSMPQAPVFVRWTLDEDATRYTDMVDAFALLAVWSTIYLVASLVAAALLHWSSSYTGAVAARPAVKLDRAPNAV